MRIAFYAPMKPPSSPVPSGDRQMARHLVRALEIAGHDVDLAAILRSHDGSGDRERQERLRALGERLAVRVVTRYAVCEPENRPAAWFTYHLYHKAPDWIGPRVCDALKIPYIVAEASFAPKQANGPWDLGHEAAATAIRRADAIIGLNSHDSACVLPLLDDPRKLHLLRPFTDVEPLADAADARDIHHAALAEAYDLDPQAAILLAVGMMRPGDKLESYRVIGEALSNLGDEPWQLLVVGDGPARPEVERALAPLGDMVRFVGEQPPERLAEFYAAADLLVWPAIREAYGVAMLEAQAAGVPVVAGNAGGVADIVRDGETGLLVREGCAEEFGKAIRLLLQAPYYLAQLSANARHLAARDHSIEAAARALDDWLGDVIRETVS